LWREWNEIFGVSSHWPNLEMIEFWASDSPEKGYQWARFFVDDLAMCDIAAEPSYSAR